MKRLHRLLRYFFIALLLASAFGKLLDMDGFYQVVASYQALPAKLVAIAAWTIALVELGLALWLLISKPLARLGPALAVLALHFIYMVWLLVAYLRGLNIPNCGCFGVFFPRPLSTQTLLEDSALIVFAAVFLWSAHQMRNDSAIVRTKAGK